MKSRKMKIALCASALTLTSLLGVASVGTGTAFAADSPSGNQANSAKTAPSAEQIAQHQAQRKSDLQNKLNQGVKTGVITQAQADALSAFFEANKPTSPPNKDATKEERQAEMKARKEKIEAFAKENNIPTSFLETLKPAKGGPGHGPGHGGKEGKPPIGDQRGGSEKSRK